VSQALAQHFWPGEDAIGKRFRLRIEPDYPGGRREREFCGLVIGEQPQPVVFLPVDQRYQSAMALVVRTDGKPTTVMPGLLKQVQSLIRTWP